MTVKTDLKLSQILNVHPDTANAFISTKECSSAVGLSESRWSKIEEVRDEIRKKFNYMVDIFVRGGTTIAVRPRGSNLNTAIVHWHENEQRYEVLSLRVHRDRCLRSSIVRRDDEQKVVAMKNAKRTASFVAGLVPYSDKEIAGYVVEKLAGVVNKIIKEDNEAMESAFSSFRYHLDTASFATEILSILDAIKNGEQIHLDEDSRLLSHYAKFDEARKSIQEKKAHTGELAEMFMLKSAVNKNIMLVTRGEEPSGAVLYAKSYDSFDALPREVQRVVMTLEVKEKDSQGIAKGVGVVPEGWCILGGECCGFVVQKETQQKFVEEVTPLWQTP
jgi:hypothetical protein